MIFYQSHGEKHIMQSGYIETLAVLFFSFVPLRIISFCYRYRRSSYFAIVNGMHLSQTASFSLTISNRVKFFSFKKFPKYVYFFTHLLYYLLKRKIFFHVVPTLIPPPVPQTQGLLLHTVRLELREQIRVSNCIERI